MPSLERLTPWIIRAVGADDITLVSAGRDDDLVVLGIGATEGGDGLLESQLLFCGIGEDDSLSPMFRGEVVAVTPELGWGFPSSKAWREATLDDRHG